MPTLFCTFLFYLAPKGLVFYDMYGKLVLLLFIFVTTFIIPTLSTVYLRASKIIPSFKMEDRSERILPFLLTSIIYIGTTLMFFYQWQGYQHLIISKVLGVISINVILSTIITFFWKISIHSVGIGGLCGLILSLDVRHSLEFSIWTLIVLFILSGIVMSARLLLASHKPQEVYIGYIGGLTISFLSGIFFLWG